MASNKDLQSEQEEKVLSILGMSIPEIIEHREKFPTPEEQEAIELLDQAQSLIENEEIDAEAWHRVVKKGLHFVKKSLMFPYLSEEERADFIPKMKMVFEKTFEQAQDRPDLEKYKEKLLGALEGKEVEFEVQPYKNEAEYRDRLYSLRLNALNQLSICKMKREEGDES